MRTIVIALASLIVPVTLLAQSDAYQIRYAANLNVGDSFIDITNAGSISGADPAGNICANVYAFDATEEPISCCSCLVTPNGLKSLSIRRDILSNTLTGGPLPGTSSVVVKLLATTVPSGGCNAAAPGALAPGMRAWGTSLHASPSGYTLTETAFSTAPLSANERSKLVSTCSFINTYASGYGQCRSCRLGGLATPGGVQAR